MLWRVLPAAAMLLAVQAQCVEIAREADAPDMGIKLPFSQDDNEWRSRTMLCPDKVDLSTRIWSGQDFFEGEYGKPCVFSEDWIKLYGYASGPYKIEGGRLSFVSGQKGFGFGFGLEPGKSERPAIRFGFNWSHQRKDLLRLRMEIEQSVDETEWEFSSADPVGKAFRNPSSFKVKGKGPQAFEADIGLVRVAMNEFCTGVRFLCKTPDASVKVKSVKIAPSSAEVFFRKSFELPEEPVEAHCSFKDDESYSLYVNGKLVSSGSEIYPCGILKSVDLKPFLKKGKNCIAFGRQFLMWNVPACRPELLFEGVSVGRSGSVFRILGDASWRSSVKRQEGWMEPAFNDSAWSAPSIKDKTIDTEMYDGRPVFTGVNPKYMGALDAAPADRKQPIFSVGETPSFKARLPIGLKGSCEPSLEVCKGGTDEAIESVKGSPSSDDGDFAVWTFEPKVRDAGPYRLLWRLRSSDGKDMELRRAELVIAGPIKQDLSELADFDSNFESRLKLVTKIDCSKPAPQEGEFLDHAGMYNAPAVNRGKVVEQDGMSYRETGLGRWDYFAYRLHLRERGVPYLAEIVVPDNKDRYIHSGITENYPVGFWCNVPSGSTGWYTATGTCYTGVRYPLSGGKKKIRYVFFPASFNSSVVVMSGFGGQPAAACEINIYKIEGGLPALKVPETDRLFGTHNERMSTMRLTTGMCENPLEFDKGYAIGPHKDALYFWYKTLERKIALLRFQGYNMSVEGLYMYTEGDYPSAKHCPRVADGSEVDPVPLMLRMYSQNGVKPIIGFEYFASPQIYMQGKGGVSERRLWAGEKSTRLVDRYGRQLFGYMNNGFNFLNPDVASTMLDCVSEIYSKYKTEPGVAGFFLVNGYWWLPTFNTHAYPELSDLEVGYDDDTVGLFEKELGLKLGVANSDPQRFQKRYELINSKHLQEWLAWRAMKMKEFSSQIAARLQDGPSKWRLYQFPTGVDFKQGTPFLDPDSRRAERESYMARRFRDFGAPLDLYKDQRDMTMVAPLGAWSKFGSARESYDYVYGWNKNPGSRTLIEELGALYVGVCNGLDEVDSPASAAKKWLFQGTARGVFTPRAVEDFAMNEFVDAVSSSRVPKAVFDQWIDCNLETGFGSQLRRFAKAFYATPDVKFDALPESAAKGVLAQSAVLADGSLCVRLINSSPYPSSGFVKCSGKPVRDLVYDRDLDSSGSLSLKPFDIRILNVKGASSGDCQFSYDAKVAESILAEAKFLLSRKDFLKKVPGDLVSRLYDGVARADAYALWTVMDDFEVLANVRAAKDSMRAAANQKLFLEDLASNGVGRIDCGSSSQYIDAKGGRWLPDQDFKGSEAYGNVGGNAVDRGGIEINDDVAPGVYRTEIYGGRLQYMIPVPPGKYNVTLHFAETFINHNKPGMRLLNVSVAGRTLEERLDIFARAGGLNTPLKIEAKGVSPSVAGLIEVELVGNACVNGVEVERCK